MSACFHHCDSSSVGGWGLLRAFLRASHSSSVVGLAPAMMLAKSCEVRSPYSKRASLGAPRSAKPMSAAWVMLRSAALFFGAT